MLMRLHLLVIIKGIADYIFAFICFCVNRWSLVPSVCRPPNRIHGMRCEENKRSSKRDVCSQQMVSWHGTRTYVDETSFCPYRQHIYIPGRSKENCLRSGAFTSTISILSSKSIRVAASCRKTRRNNVPKGHRRLLGLQWGTAHPSLLYFHICITYIHTLYLILSVIITHFEVPQQNHE